MGNCHTRRINENTCPNCRGVGYDSKNKTLCYMCFGVGIVLSPNTTICPKCVCKKKLVHYVGNVKTYVDCDVCSGTGVVKILV